MDSKRDEQKKIIETNATLQYECKGYQIRIHFSEETTLLHCLENLIEHHCED